jgi:OmpA family protein
MRTLLVGVALLALAAPAAHAQQTGEPTAAAASGQAEPGTFLVHFGFDRATLDADARRVVAEAADEYRRTGAAQVAVTGHADKAGRAEYNQRLSERRAEAVRRELERLGVQSSAITVAAEGENDPAVPTADGAPEARNRRVVIAMPQPAPPAAPPAVAAEPPPPPVTAEAPPAREPERPKRFVFSLGPVYGHNFREKDRGRTEDDLGGAELTLNALPGFLGGLSLKQDVLWAFDAADDGLAGRSVLSLDFAPDLGFVRPRLSANFGGVYGKGVQAGLVAGPELALDLNLLPGFTLRPKVAYDFQLRNPSWDEGILWAGLDLGIRF